MEQYKGGGWGGGIKKNHPTAHQQYDGAKAGMQRKESGKKTGMLISLDNERCECTIMCNVVVMEIAQYAPLCCFCSTRRVKPCCGFEQQRPPPANSSW